MRTNTLLVSRRYVIRETLPWILTGLWLFTVRWQRWKDRQSALDPPSRPWSGHWIKMSVLMKGESALFKSGRCRGGCSTTCVFWGWSGNVMCVAADVFILRFVFYVFLVCISCRFFLNFYLPRVSSSFCRSFLFFPSIHLSLFSSLFLSYYAQGSVPGTAVSTKACPPRTSGETFAGMWSTTGGCGGQLDRLILRYVRLTTWRSKHRTVCVYGMVLVYHILATLVWAWLLLESVWTYLRGSTTSGDFAVAIHLGLLYTSVRLQVNAKYGWMGLRQDVWLHE